jgi:hypothetical protein
MRMDGLRAKNTTMSAMSGCRNVGRDALASLLNVDAHKLADQLREWTEHALATSQYGVDEKWSSSIAVGSQEFVAQFQSDLGMAGSRREVDKGEHCYRLREPGAPYRTVSSEKIGTLSVDKCLPVKENG